MMKKRTILALLFAAGTLLTAASSLAAPRAMKLPSRMAVGGGGAVIGTTTYITPGNAEIILDEVSVFAGKSCSSMTKITDLHSSPDTEWVADSEQVSFTSEDIIEGVGPGMGCVREDDVYHGKTVSTGPIRLIWDSNAGQYTHAYPRSTVMNYN